MNCSYQSGAQQSKKSEEISRGHFVDGAVRVRRARDEPLR